MSDRPLDEKPKQEPKPLLIGAKPAALMLGISRTTLDLLVRKGEIPCVRLGGRVLFSVAVLEAIARGEGRTK
jgi:excisionase family DNA binding protein